MKNNRPGTSTRRRLIAASFFLLMASLGGTASVYAQSYRTGNFDNNQQVDIIRFNADGTSEVWLSNGSVLVYQGQWGTGMAMKRKCNSGTSMGTA